MKTLTLVFVAALMGAWAAPASVRGQESTKIELANGKLVLTTPDTWKKLQPKGIVEYEFSAPGDAKPDAPTARITMMPAGGSIAANIERWYGQFEQPDGKSTKEKSKSEKFDVAGQTVHWVDIPGNFKDSMGGGPFSGGKTVLRENYRMLGAIIVTKDQGQYFIKMTGPDDVVKKLSDGFRKSLKELQVK